MKFKVIEVYSGYGEMDIVEVENDEMEGGIDEIVNVLWKFLKDIFIDNDNIDYWEEFNGKKVIDSNMGVFGCSEEGYSLVIGEGSKWYKMFEGDWRSKWDDKNWDEWMKLNESVN